MKWLNLLSKKNKKEKNCLTYLGQARERKLHDMVIEEYKRTGQKTAYLKYLAD